MIVLFNVKITDIRMGYPYARGAWMPNDQRMDVFKYCLASHAVLEPVVDKFVFYITVSEELQHRQQELDEYIHNLIPSNKLLLKWQRNDYGRDWLRNCEELLTDPNQLVWLAANDDHIFMDTDLDLVKSAIKTLKAEQDPNAVVYYSHWPEQMRVSVHFNGQLTQDRNFIRYEWENFDGIQIMRASRLHAYWSTRDYGDALIFKPDYLGAYHNYRCPGAIYAPTKPLTHHYEGYSHVGPYLANISPPLFIPPGFFNNELKIRVGFTDRDNTCVNINPSSEWLYNYSPAGTDYRWVYQDLPLFWQDKIVEVNTQPDYNVDLMNQARDAAFFAATRIPMNMEGFKIKADSITGAPRDWFSNHLLGTQ